MFNFCIFIAYRLRLNLQYIAIFFTNGHFYAKKSTSLSFYVVLLTEQLAQLFNNFVHFYLAKMSFAFIAINCINSWLLVATSVRAIISYPY